VKSHFVLALCAVLVSGCAAYDVRMAPNPVLREADPNGVSTLAILPASYDAKKAVPWIIYDHGFGQTIDSIVTNPPQQAFVQSLVDAGFVVVASEYREIECWGNMDCVEDIANLETLWRSRLNLMPQPFVIGESMGGIVTWNAISHGALDPLAVVGIYPACNLGAMYTVEGFADSIQAAYGFTNPTELSAATSGFDPILTPPSVFTGFPIQIWASDSDHFVVRSMNEDPFAKAVNAEGGNVTIHTSHGEHGDPTNFNAPAVVSFFTSRLP
jgi:fermentation-respiration switch protein FrsA (DUF1100 family)